MPVELPKYPSDEIARRGDEIYEQLRPQLEPGNRGNIVAIDVHSGKYALGPTPLEAARALRAQCPDAEAWVLRIGHRGVYEFGFGLMRNLERTSIEEKNHAR